VAAAVPRRGQTFTYGAFTAALAGDCPTPTNMRGSLTIGGAQTGSGFAFSLCVRNENLVDSGVPIDLADGELIQVVDVSARDAAGCTYVKDAAAPNPPGPVVLHGHRPKSRGV